MTGVTDVVMAGETTLTIVGNLTAGPELRYTPSGAAVANFTVASTSRTFDRRTGEWVDGDALFLRCTAWRALAEDTAESLRRGTHVIVTGGLRQRSFDGADGAGGPCSNSTLTRSARPCATPPSPVSSRNLKGLRAGTQGRRTSGDRF